MKRTLAGLFLFVLGLNAEEYYRAHIYVSTPMAWIQAYNYCKTYYTDLSAITSQEKHQLLVAAAGGTFSEAWIGLYRPAGNPNILAWSNGQSYSFTKLNNDDKAVSCVYATKLEWYMGSCQNEFPFFCHLDYELMLVGMIMTWEDALEYCRNWSADLASATDQYQLEILQNKTKASTTEGVWTGLRFLAGEWHWVSKTFRHIPFQDSLPSCPEEPYRCGARNNRTAQWEMRDCEEKLNFICYQVKVSTRNVFIFFSLLKFNSNKTLNVFIPY